MILRHSFSLLDSDVNGDLNVFFHYDGSPLLKHARQISLRMFSLTCTRTTTTRITFRFPHEMTAILTQHFSNSASSTKNPRPNEYATIKWLPSSIIRTLQEILNWLCDYHLQNEHKIKFTFHRKHELWLQETNLKMKAQNERRIWIPCGWSKNSPKTNYQNIKSIN